MSLALLTSCSSSKVIVDNSGPDINHTDPNVSDYVSRYANIAVIEMQRTGIPASITLAQGIIESDYGRSRLATQANNHFGIKCHSDWKGRKIYHDDDRRNECFRSYGKAEDSYTDHSDFIRNGSRYRFLFDLSPDDYKGWARGLKTAGYATNPKYANMLITMIEKNDLFLYDQHAMGKRITQRDIRKPVEQIVGETGRSAGNRVGTDNFVIKSAHNRILERNRIQYIIVRKGDSYESLAKEFDLLSWELFRYNDLEDGMELYEGQLLYLQPKRLKAEAGNDFHTIKEGETMYSVSQLYGIRLRTLYERNRLDEAVEPPVGSELWLRKTRPEGLR